MTKRAMRKAARSGKSKCPCCPSRVPLVEHHIHGRDHPDYNKPWNRAYICPNCHDEVHLGLLIIEGWISTTVGKELAFHRKGEEQEYMEGATPPIYGQTPRLSKLVRTALGTDKCDRLSAALRTGAISAEDAKEIAVEAVRDCGVMVVWGERPE